MWLACSASPSPIHVVFRVALEEDININNFFIIVSRYCPVYVDG